MSTYSVLPPAAHPLPEAPGHLIAGLVLISLGVALLVGNTLEIDSALLLIGLGGACTVARVAADRYGLAVPAGLLLSAGAFAAAQRVGAIASGDSGALLVSSGVGFAVVYLIGGRPAALWPLVPAAVLTGSGLVLGGVINASALAALLPSAPYLPIGLVLIGLWLLLTSRVPTASRATFDIALAVAAIALTLVALGIASEALQTGSGLSTR